MKTENLFKMSKIPIVGGFGGERLPKTEKRPVFEEKITIEKEIN